MSRHWLRDEIYFGMSSACDDDCPRCNRAAQEIADSLALDECDHETADYAVVHDRLEDWAQLTVTCKVGR